MADPVKPPYPSDEEELAAVKEELSAVDAIGKLLDGDEELKHIWRDLMFGFGMKCLRCDKEITKPEMSKMTNNQRETLLHERCQGS